MASMSEKLSEKILLVDDEPAIGSIVAEMIGEHTGFQSVLAESGRQALSLIESTQFFLAILDIRMPEMDGFALAREIIRTRPEIPCVFMSGWADRDAAIEALKIGIRDILDKPVDVDKVVDTVKRFANERWARITEEREMAAQVRTTFIEEAASILRDLDDMVMGLEDPSRQTDYVQLIFRRVHTIKGSSGAVEGATSITVAAHAFESALTPFRDVRGPIPTLLLDAMLRTVDFLKSAVRMDDLGASRMSDAEALKAMLERAAEGGVPAGDTIAGPGPSGKSSDPLAEKDEGVLVDNAKLDRFMSLAGDLVVFKNNFSGVAREAGHVVTGIADMEKSLQKLSDDLQGQILEVRKVRLDRILGKIPRIVRQTAQQVGKKIRLTLEGAQLEVDKNLATALSACLTHMVRNSCDHGIESPGTRALVGKQAEGHIQISAELSGGYFNVTISDDGAGIDPDKLRGKAVQSGSLTEEQARALSTEQAYQLIFASGFSTSVAVTEVSGRGVGMDAVKSALDKVGGRVDVESTPGRGTRFHLRMPIPRTVVIERAILASCGTMQIAVPLDAVAEVRSIKPSEFVVYEDRLAVPHRDSMIDVGALADLLDPRRSGGWTRPDALEIVVVMQHRGRMLGLRLDRVIDQIEAVVRPFDSTLGKLPGFKGVISIGSEKMAYVLSVDEIMSGTI